MMVLQESIIWLAHYHIFPPGEHFRMTYYTSRFFFWCISGRGTVVLDDKRYTISQGDFCFLRWGQTIIYDAAPVEPMIIGCVHLIPWLVGEETEDLKEIFWVPAPGNPAYERRKDAPIPDVDDMFLGHAAATSRLLRFSEYLVSALQEKHPWGILHSFAQIFLHELVNVRKETVVGVEKMPIVLRDLLQFIEQNLDKDIPIKSLVHRSGYSAMTLYRMFNQYLGMNVTAWIFNRKMELACELLCTTTLRISEIGAKIGFYDQFYFSKLVRKFTGMTASEYRKRHSMFALY